MLSLKYEPLKRHAEQASACRFNGSLLAFVCLLLLGVSGCNRAPSGPVFNVPALMGKTIDEATQKLGPPIRTENGPDNLPRRVWVKNDVTLWANWKAQSGRITRWGFRARDDKNAVSEENRADLLKTIEATDSDARYSVQWNEAPERPLFYTGATIVPVPQTHTVKFRITGSEKHDRDSCAARAAGNSQRFHAHYSAMGSHNSSAR